MSGEGGPTLWIKSDFSVNQGLGSDLRTGQDMKSLS